MRCFVVGLANRFLLPICAHPARFPLACVGMLCYGVNRFNPVRRMVPARSDKGKCPYIFQISEVKKAGGLDALQSAGTPADLLRETKERMFAA